MELTQGSETSANYNLTPGKYPKEYIQYSNHGESLKSRHIIILHQHVLVNPVIIIRVSYNKNTINIQIIFQICMIKPLDVTL